MPFRPSSVVLFALGVLLSSSRLSTSESSRVCSGEGFPFVHALESRCPASISPYPPLKLVFEIWDPWFAVNYTGECDYKDSLLRSQIASVSHPILRGKYSFRASVLRSPSLHLNSLRFPCIGSKSVSILPYTGIKPVQPLVLDLPTSGQAGGNSIMQLSELFSLKEITSSEPYLVLSVLFICLRALLIVLPGLLSHLNGLWLSYVPYLKLKIFGETTQIWGRIVQAVDVRRTWTKTRLCKVRSLHKRVRSARVWASSLASVSLGESSSARSSS